ncbi:amidohydrolase family protein [Streptomyces sp. AD2-2]|nr:amidohydrolase family protein [Streptomyces sp. AD2-2]
MPIWEPDAMVDAVEAVVRRGWRVGTHAYGDRAVRILLDVYEQVLARNPGLPAGTLVMERGGLAGPEQRVRAVELGIPVTIQQPLLHDTAEVEEGFWGPERVARLFPARGWIDLGAQVSAGSDFPVGRFGAMRSVYGMTTRQTVIGVKGPQRAIGYDEALTLHTVNAARLCGDQDLRGTLRDLNPVHTIVGGRLVTR